MRWQHTYRSQTATLLHFVCHSQVSTDGETVIYLADAQNQSTVTATQLNRAGCGGYAVCGVCRILPSYRPVTAHSPKPKVRWAGWASAWCTTWACRQW